MHKMKIKLQMKIRTLILLIFAFSFSLQAQTTGSWHDWSAAKMRAVIKNNCTWQYSQAAIYQDSSLLVTYTAGASLTFPYNYANSLTAGGVFFMPFLNLSATHVQDTIGVEFILNGVVKATFKMAGRKPGWNVMSVRQENSVITQGFDISVINGLIPDIPTQIRINFPKKTGSVYLGKLLLCTDATWTALNLSATVPQAPDFAINNFTLTSTPGSVSSAQQSSLQQIATKMDEAFDVLPEAAITNVPAATMTDIQARFNSWNIVRNGNVINGVNKMLFYSTPDYNTTTSVYGQLALDIAQNYRNTQSTAEKSALLSMFYDVFDYGIFIGGMYESWSNGYNFAAATFLMRDKLKETSRITPEVLSDFKRNIGYNRIYLPYSYMCKESDLYAGRPYRNGELGEDIDYIRITSWRLIMFNLLNSNEAEQVRDMSAISSYFSNIAFQYSPSILDGFKPDGTINHHWGWIDQYGMDGLFWATHIVYILSNSDFKVSQQAYRLIYDELKAQDMRSLYNIVPATLSGKGGEIYRQYGGNSQTSIDRYACMALACDYNGGAAPDSYMSQTYLRMVKDQALSTAYAYTPFEQKAKTQLGGLGFTANSMPSGHSTLSYGAAFIHRRHNWMVSLKAASKFQYVRESSDPFVTFLSHGLLEIVTSTWNRYGLQKLKSDFGTSGYDWAKMPGTTAVAYADYTKMINKEYKRFWPNTTFVGGVMQDGNGVFTLQLAGSVLNGLGSFIGTKTYFCFDNTLVCVGSNLSNSISGDNTVTTLFQDAVGASDKTYLNSMTGSTAIINSQSITTPAWLMDSHSIGYWIPSGQNLQLSRNAQTNRDWANATSLTGTFATAWINHGAAPKNATYSYIVKVNAQPADMVTFDTQMQGTTPPFRILASNAQMHAVEDVNNNQYGVAAFNPTISLNVKDIVAVDKPCLLMVKDLGGQKKKLSLSYPNLDFIDHTLYPNNVFWGYSTPNTVNVLLKGDWQLDDPSLENVSVQLKTENGFTSFNVVLKDGLSRDIVFKYAPITAVTRLKSNEIQTIITHDLISISVPDNDYLAGSDGRILNMLGIAVKNFTFKGNITTISISDLKPGIYILYCGKNNQIKKFIKL